MGVEAAKAGVVDATPVLLRVGVASTAAGCSALGGSYLREVSQHNLSSSAWHSWYSQALQIKRASSPCLIKTPDLRGYSQYGVILATNDHRTNRRDEVVTARLLAPDPRWVWPLEIIEIEALSV